MHEPPAASNPPLSAMDRAARTRLLPGTPVTLLQRIKEARDTTAWDDLVRLLAPLIDFWVRRTVPDANDRADIAQDVFLELSKRLPAWEYDASRSFRAWLRTVTRSRCVDFFRRRGRPDAEYELSQVLADQAPDLVEQHEVRLLTRSALKLLRTQVRADVWDIFQQYVLDEEPAATVAQACGVEVNYVYLVRSRLLARLRGLLENIRD
jgi:RNA polymerase sigma-70 factor, ECF subfamily